MPPMAQMLNEPHVLNQVSPAYTRWRVYLNKTDFLFVDYHLTL